eukprot:TRINITY_DN22072_c0_g1_i1.p1 TRINITY_DN22072_c0_g1~~TRINITY_DN22072_c0_g1_i1.p1  ORF type:complete len:486 (+),score=123.89 TRINITY_DN22072_c0_g1_i1:10-1467(+)
MAGIDEKSPPPPPLVRQSSSVQIANWLSESPGRGIPEYDEQLAKCCVSMRYMQSSVLNQVTAYLDNLMKSKPLPSSFDDLLTKVIRTAYPDTPNDTAARSVMCVLTERIIWNRVKPVRDNLEWRAKYMDCMLRELADENASSQIVSILADIMDSSTQCKSRQRYSFDLLLDAYRGIHLDEITAFHNNSAGVRNPASTSAPESEEENIDQIMREWIDKFMEQYKMKAYKAAFIEPAKLYIYCTGSKNHHTVEFHATNLYGVLLLATVGVQVPVPDIHDEDMTVGLAEFLSCESEALENALNELKLAETFGRGFMSLKSLKELASAGKLNRKWESQFVFRLGRNPVESVHAATKSATIRQRQQYAKYLNNFFYFFEPKVFVERFLSVACQERHRELQFKFELMKAKIQQSKLASQKGVHRASFREALECEDYRLWIWDAVEGTIDVNRGLIFLEFLGVTRDSSTFGSSSSSSPAQVKPSGDAVCQVQ